MVFILFSVKKDRFYKTKGCVITDLGSANGTYVNGKKIPPNQPVWLKNGMIVKIGMNTFKFAEREE